MDRFATNARRTSFAITAEKGAFEAYNKNSTNLFHTTSHKEVTETETGCSGGGALFFTTSKKRRRSISKMVAPETELEKEAQPTSQTEKRVSNDNGNNNNVTTVSVGPLKKRKRTDLQQSQQQRKFVFTTKTQRDILSILQTLQDYCNGSNKASFLTFERIPTLLLSIVGAHCEKDPKAVILASRGIVRFATRNASPNLRRRAILPELFGQALRSGGTEHALQAIQKLGIKYWGNDDDDEDTDCDDSDSNTISSTDRTILKKTLIGCWKVVLVGIRAGLSHRMLLLVIQACLADLEEIDAEQGTLTCSFTEQFDLLLVILRVVSAAITELPREHIISERHCILKASLSLLSSACMSGIGNDDVMDNSDDDEALCVIEDVLEILTICAQKRLLLRSDYERLVPACKASLSRFSLCRKLQDGNPIGSSIPMLVVQLIEAEDATVGLWLRETYGIPKKTETVNRRPVQQPILAMSILAMQQQQQQQQQQQRRASLINNNNNNNDSSRQDSIPTPPPPPPPPKFRSILVCEPDSDEDFSEDDDDDDEGDYCWFDRQKEESEKKQKLGEPTTTTTTQIAQQHVVL